MAYRVKEAFYSIQGEGLQAGRPAVFCRFSGCNLWSGKAADKPGSACPFCDTDFVGTDGKGGGVFDTAASLADHLISCWPKSEEAPYLVFTGGEPSLQLDAPLLTACKTAGFTLAVETNGTRALPEELDWVTVSPKPGQSLTIIQGDELKLLYPIGLDPADFENLDFRYFFLQPVDIPDGSVHIRQALDYCLRHPRWRLSLQLHKLIGVR